MTLRFMVHSVAFTFYNVILKEYIESMMARRFCKTMLWMVYW